MSITDDTKTKMDASIEHLKEELKGIRTGRANPAMLDKITVDVYGTHMRIRDIATVSNPESQQLLITPYDANNAEAISKAITVGNVGLNPFVDGNVVRINVPPMDASIREQMVRLCREKREECKIGVRNVRRDSNDHARKQKSDSEITEDELKRIEKEIQDLTDKYCKIADEITEVKEKEVTSI